MSKEFKPIEKMSLKEYLERFLPADHNEQDKIYLQERYKWHTQKGYDYSNVHLAFEGTTFSKRI